MTIARKLGIWMDHANAHLMEFNSDPERSNTVVSKFTHDEKDHDSGESEKLMHNKENHDQSDYYKKIANAIRNYDDILLFGPTDAKAELYNLMKDDHHFSKIRIAVKPADKMNSTQQYAFAKEYFQNTDIMF